MKNSAKSFVIASCLALYPQFLSASENSSKKVEFSVCPIHNDAHYLGNVKCVLIDENKPLVIKEFDKNDKHNNRLKKRREFAEHPKHQDEDWYQEFKNALANKYNTEYTFDLTYMPQRGAPNGNKTPQQLVWAPYLSIMPFKDTFIGTGQIQFSYTGIQYWGEEAQKMQNRIHVGSGINDYTDSELQFSQLLYSHTMPGSMNWLSVNIGQYSLYLIDGTPQDYNQQTGFISYSLSQYGSASYPTASLGAYLQFTPNSEWMMQVGFQDANNISGRRIKFNTFDDGEYTSYMYVSWSPTFLKTWAGQYMFLTYNQPSTTNQPGDSQGWSFSFSQYFGESFNIFGRVNGSSGNVVPIKKSIVAGFGFKDLFNRNPNDYVGIGLGFNSMSKESLGQSAIHKYENVIEAQYVFGIGKYLTITPDIQFFMNPALDQDQSTATVFSLRLGLTI